MGCGDVALQHIPPGGICSRGGGHGPHAGQGVVTEQPPHCREGTAGGGGQSFKNIIGRNFKADGPWQKLGTDVTEFKLSFGKADLDAYITHWNTVRRQVKLKGLTPAEYRDQALQEAA